MRLFWEVIEVLILNDLHVNCLRVYMLLLCKVHNKKRDDRDSYLSS